MKKNETQKLVDRYLDGVTTPEEEKRLARELLRDDIPDEWKVVRIMLGELAMGEAEYEADMAVEAERKRSIVMPVAARWLAAAGVALLVVFVCFYNAEHRGEKVVVAKVRTDSTAQKNWSGSLADDKEHVVEQLSNIQTTAERRKVNNSTAADGAELNASEVVPTEPDIIEELKNRTTEKPQNRTTAEPYNPTTAQPHYAAITENDTLDNNYQAPSRMEEFIVKMANYNHVKGESLTTSKDDSLTVSTAYVFEDTKNLNLFNRLLQAACWYDDTTPGYLLNYSHQQFFFRLKDMRLGMQYLWIAERVRGKILLYSTSSPLDTEVSSDSFREYRDKLSNTSINSKKL